ncbi:hypothetical protein M0R45_008512 [Rubus argutus]|uniref:Uncharacterized protein n=1 Tax=Rubus argutus TaxID=59490 RepID=A0AAW1Y1E9_RUBAR
MSGTDGSDAKASARGVMWERLMKRRRFLEAGSFIEGASQTPTDSSIGTTPTPGSTVERVGALVLVSQLTQGTSVPPPHAQTLVSPAPHALDGFGTKRKNKFKAWDHFTK